MPARRFFHDMSADVSHSLARLGIRLTALPGLRSPRSPPGAPLSAQVTRWRLLPSHLDASAAPRLKRHRLVAKMPHYHGQCDRLAADWGTNSVIPHEIVSRLHGVAATTVARLGDLARRAIT